MVFFPFLSFGDALMTKRALLEVKDHAPLLIGVIHLPPLPGSVQYGGHCTPLENIVATAVEEASLLQEAGFSAILIENFNDVPYPKIKAEPETIASITIIVREVVDSVKIPVGISILRNCALDSLAVAHVTGASFIRVNVLSHACVTDQGIIEGIAVDLHRKRQFLNANHVKILADVDVKHSTPLDMRPVEERALELETRSLTDVVLVTGSRTGTSPSLESLKRIRSFVSVPLLVASGVNEDNMRDFITLCDGFIVGSAIKRDGKAGNPVDPERTRKLASAFEALRKNI